MSRKRMTDQIKQSLEEKGIPFEGEDKLASALIDEVLDYMIEFGLGVSQELVGVGLYSESMIAGLFIRKMKSLKHS